MNWPNRERGELKYLSFSSSQPVSPRPQSMWAVVLRSGNYVSMSADGASRLVDLRRGRRGRRRGETLRFDEAKVLHHLSPRVSVLHVKKILTSQHCVGNIVGDMLIGGGNKRVKK